MILLDTCVLLWLASDISQISPPARDAINLPGQAVFALAISAYEIGQKAKRGLLTLPLPIDKWFPAMLAQHSIQELPVTGAIAAKATLLPPIHQDPFDRLLIAASHEHQLTLVTPDPFIRQYPTTKTLW
jgi:PIN domain nuclease of toxin-antitoxin system